MFVAYDSGSKPNFSLAGGRTQSQMFWIDGGTGQNMRLGIGQVDVDPLVDTVQEVKNLANNCSAEYGGPAGGVIIATTKSGTSSFRGSAFEYSATMGRKASIGAVSCQFPPHFLRPPDRSPLASARTSLPPDYEITPRYESYTVDDDV